MSPLFALKCQTHQISSYSNALSTAGGSDWHWRRGANLDGLIGSCIVRKSVFHGSLKMGQASVHVFIVQNNVTVPQ